MAEASCKWYDPSCSLHWLSDELKALWLYFYDAFMSGLAAIVEAIPVPDFLSSVQTITLPPTLSWFLEPFNIPTGLLFIVGAYTARFILRRLPFIG